VQITGTNVRSDGDDFIQSQRFLNTDADGECLDVGFAFVAGMRNLVLALEVTDITDDVSVFGVPNTIDVCAPIGDVVLDTGAVALSSCRALTKGNRTT
jgi:hypothetical protein